MEKEKICRITIKDINEVYEKSNFLLKELTIKIL